MNENDDVLSESSAEIEQTNNDASVSEAAPTEAAPAQAKPEDNVPFHLHPRFQEVISQKNELANQVKQFQAQMAELQSKMPKAEPAKDELMERLKSIDPAFADRFGKIGEVDKLRAELEEVRQWRSQQSAQVEHQAVMSSKEKFYSEKKVAAEHRELYENALFAAAQRDPNLKTSDLPQVMNGIHEKLGKLLTSVQRDATKQLVTAKKADASRPGTLPKGSSAQKGDGKGSMSKADAKADLISKVMADLKSSKDI